MLQTEKATASAISPVRGFRCQPSASAAGVPLDGFTFPGFPGKPRGLHLANIGKGTAQLPRLVLHRELGAPQRDRRPHRRYALLDQGEKEIDLVLSPASSSYASHE